MRLSIHATGFLLTEALRSHAEQRIAIALGWARQHMRTLVVSLSDINGPRGGVDKRCHIQVQLSGGRTVIIEDIEDDLYLAINRAAERADRALVRHIRRRRDFSHQRLSAAADADRAPLTPERDSAAGQCADPAHAGGGR